MKKIFTAILLLMFILVIVTGCNGSIFQDESALVGRWIFESSSIEYNRAFYGSSVGSILEITLFKDETGQIIIEDRGRHSGYGCTWKEENNRLHVTVAGGMAAFSCDYKVSGSTLTIIDDGEREFIYKKQ